MKRTNKLLEYTLEGAVVLSLILLIVATWQTVSLTGNTILNTNQTGVWIEIKDDTYKDGSALFSNTNLSELIYTFNGSNPTIITQYRNDFGIVDIYIDDVLQKQIDLYAEATTYNISIPIATNLSAENHTLRVAVSGRSNPLSSGFYVLIDDLIDEYIQPYFVNVTIVNHTDIQMQSPDRAISSGTWSIVFNTTNTATLTIQGINGTIIGANSDVAFESLSCQSPITTIQGNNSIRVENYYCTENSTALFTILSATEHFLQFTFNQTTDDTYNDGREPLQTEEFTTLAGETVTSLNITPAGSPLDTDTSVGGMWRFSNTGNTLENRTVYTWYINSSELWREPSLVAYYRFDDNVKNVEGNTILNAITTSQVTNRSGIIGGAVHVDPDISMTTDETVNLTNNSAFNFNGPFSITYWFKMLDDPSVTSQSASILDKKNEYSMYVDTTNKLNADITVSSSDQSVTGPKINHSQWYHIGFSYNGSDLRLYVNGKFTDNRTAAGTMDVTANALVVGMQPGEASRTNITIDELRLYNRTLSEFDINNLFHMSDYGETERSESGSYAPDVPLAAWNFNEEGGNIILDSFGSYTASAGNLSLNTRPAFVAGMHDTIGLEFDGVDDFVNVSHNRELISDSITVMAWLKSYDTTKNSRIVSKFAGNSGYGIHLNDNTNCRPNSLCWVVHDGTNAHNASIDVSNISNNTWHHVTGTWNGTELTLYLDGDNRSTTKVTGTMGVAITPLCIGSESDSGSLECHLQHFNGTIDEVTIYNRTLTPEEINQTVNRSAPVFGLPKSYYPTGGNLILQVQPGSTTGIGSQANTTTYTITVNEKVNPSWNNPRNNDTDITNGENVLFEMNWSDDTALSHFIFSINDSGAYVNSTAVLSAGKANIANATATISSAAGAAVGWRFYMNDTFGNANASDIQTFTVGAKPPSASRISVSPLNLTSQNAVSGNWNYSHESNNFQNGSNYQWFINDTPLWKDQSLVGYWPMDYHVRNEEGNAKLHGDVNYTYLNNVTGIIGNAFHFESGPGIVGGINISNNTAFKFQNFTFMAWVYVELPPSDAGQDPYIIIEGGPSLRIGSDKLTATIQSTTLTGPNIPNNTWFHAAVTHNGSWAILYLNGQIVDNKSEIELVPFPGTMYYIGGGTGPGDPMNHTLDEVYIYNRSLSTNEIREHYNFMSHGTTEQREDGTKAPDVPIAAWHFDERSGSMSSEYFNEFNASLGNLSAKTRPAWSEGYYGTSGLTFDGDDDFVNVSNSPQFVNNQTTLEVWFKTQDATKRSRIVSHRTANTGGFILGLNVQTVCPPSSFCWAVNVDESWAAVSIDADNVTNNTWHHAAGTWNGTTLELYFNGNKRKSGAVTGSMSPSTNALCIGAETTIDEAQCGGHGFNGTIDEVILYNRSLTEEEINISFNRGFPLFGLPNSTLTTGANIRLQITPSDGQKYGNQINSSSINVAVIENVNPAWSTPAKNITTVNSGLNVLFQTAWTDNIDLGTYIFATNDTGAWVNSSEVKFAGTTNTSTQAYKVTAGANTIVGWQFHAIDEKGNKNSTAIQSFTVAPDLPIIRSLNITPSNITSEMSISANWNYTQSDNLTQNGTIYQWYVNDTPAWKDPGLVGYWPMDYHVRNEEGNAKLNGDVNYTALNNASGIIGNAFHFEAGIGTIDGINISNNTAFSMQNFTLLSWVYVNLPPKDAGEASYGIISGGPTLSIGDDELTATVGGTTLTGPNIPNKTWFHAAVTHNGTWAVLYLNGNVVDNKTHSDPIAFAGSMFYIGGIMSAMNHTLDEVKIYNRSLSTTEIQQQYYMMTRGATEQVEDGSIQPDIPIAMWHLDEGQDTLANEFFSGYSATLGNSSTKTRPEWTTGYYGTSGLLFDGIDDFANTSNYTEIQSNTTTIELWFKTYDGTKNSTLVSTREQGGFELSMNTGVPCAENSLCWLVRVNNAWHNASIASSNITNNSWHQAIGTWNGTELSLFLDGKRRATTKATGSLSYSNTGMCLGAQATLLSSACAGSYYNGTIDEIAIYNRSLTEREVNFSYFRGFALFGLHQSAYATGDTVRVQIEPNNGRSYGSQTNSSAHTVTVIERVNPAFGTIQTNDSIVRTGENILFQTDWTDNVQLNSYIFSTNDSGSWVNQTIVYFSGTSNTSTATITTSATLNSVVGWRFYGIDQQGNKNATGIQTFTIQPSPPVVDVSNVSAINVTTRSAVSGEWNYSHPNAQAENGSVYQWFIDDKPEWYDEGLVAYYPLDLHIRNEEGNSALDGNFNDTFFTNVTGIIGNALHSEKPIGLGEAINVSNNSAFIFTNQYTLMAWVWVGLPPSDAGESGYSIISNGDVDLTIGDDELTASAQDTTLTGPNIPNKTWFHAAVVYNTTNGILYLNGRQVAIAAKSSTISPTGGMMSIAGNVNALSATNLTVDEVRIYNRSLTQSEILDIFTFMGRGGTEFTEDGTYAPDVPIALWRFDEGIGNYSNSLFGEYRAKLGNDTIGSKPIWATGRYGTGGLYFNGSGQYVNISHQSSFESNTTTIDLWFKTNDSTRNATIISKFPTGGYELSLSAETFCPPRSLCWVVRIGNAYHNVSLSAGRIANDTWHNVVSTWNGTELVLYLNGNKEGTTRVSGSMTSSGKELCIGSGSSSKSCSERFFKGTIDEVTIFNRSLSEKEVNASYRKTHPLFGLSQESIRTAFNVTFQAEAKDGTFYSSQLNSTIFNITDRTPPNINSITSSVSTSTATITVKANERVNNTLNYSTSATLAGGIAIIKNLSTTHVYSLSGLSAATAYHYNVTSCDRANNCVTNSTSVTTSGTPAVPSSGSPSSSKPAPAPPAPTPQAGVTPPVAIKAPLTPKPTPATLPQTPKVTSAWDTARESQSGALANPGAYDPFSSVDSTAGFIAPKESTIPIGQVAEYATEKPIDQSITNQLSFGLQSDLESTIKDRLSSIDSTNDLAREQAIKEAQMIVERAKTEITEDAKTALKITNSIIQSISNEESKVNTQALTPLLTKTTTLTDSSGSHTVATPKTLIDAKEKNLAFDVEVRTDVPGLATVKISNIAAKDVLKPMALAERIPEEKKLFPEQFNVIPITQDEIARAESAATNQITGAVTHKLSQVMEVNTEEVCVTAEIGLNQWYAWECREPDGAKCKSDWQKTQILRPGLQVVSFILPVMDPGLGIGPQPYTGYCGDTICSGAENPYNCPSDCKENSSTGSASGIGAVTGYTTASTCSENWTCTDWSNWDEDKNRHRTCRDENNCQTILATPELTQTCPVERIGSETLEENIIKKLREVLVLLGILLTLLVSLLIARRRRMKSAKIKPSKKGTQKSKERNKPRHSIAGILKNIGENIFKLPLRMHHYNKVKIRQIRISQTAYENRRKRRKEKYNKVICEGVKSALSTTKNLILQPITIALAYNKEKIRQIRKSQTKYENARIKAKETFSIEMDTLHGKARDKWRELAAHHHDFWKHQKEIRAQRRVNSARQKAHAAKIQEDLKKLQAAAAAREKRQQTRQLEREEKEALEKRRVHAIQIAAKRRNRKLRVQRYKEKFLSCITTTAHKTVDIAKKGHNMIIDGVQNTHNFYKLHRKRWRIHSAAKARKKAQDLENQKAIDEQNQALRKQHARYRRQKQHRLERQQEAKRIEEEKMHTIERAAQMRRYQMLLAHHKELFCTHVTKISKKACNTAINFHNAIRSQIVNIYQNLREQRRRRKISTKAHARRMEQKRIQEQAEQKNLDTIKAETKNKEFQSRLLEKQRNKKIQQKQRAISRAHWTRTKNSILFSIRKVLAQAKNRRSSIHRTTENLSTLAVLNNSMKKTLTNLQKSTSLSRKSIKSLHAEIDAVHSQLGSIERKANRELDAYEKKRIALESALPNSRAHKNYNEFAKALHISVTDVVQSLQNEEEKIENQHSKISEHINQLATMTAESQKTSKYRTKILAQLETEKKATQDLFRILQENTKATIRAINLEYKAGEDLHKVAMQTIHHTLKKVKNSLQNIQNTLHKRANTLMEKTIHSMAAFHEQQIMELTSPDSAYHSQVQELQSSMPVTILQPITNSLPALKSQYNQLSQEKVFIDDHSRIEDSMHRNSIKTRWRNRLATVRALRNQSRAKAAQLKIQWCALKTDFTSVKRLENEVEKMDNKLSFQKRVHLPGLSKRKFKTLRPQFKRLQIENETINELQKEQERLDRLLDAQ